jgi:primosomal protein N' (replication factor Y)
MKVPVLIPKVFNFPMTYESGNQKSLKPGDLVIVPFGKKKEIGVIWDKIQISKKIFKIKTIEKKLDSFSIKKNLIEYINWFSSYNLVSKGRF